MDLLQPVAAIILVLGLLGLVLFLLRKKGALGLKLPSMGGPRQMQVVERIALGPQHALHLVRVGGRSMVIATAPSSCQLISDEALFEKVER